MGETDSEPSQLNASDKPHSVSSKSNYKTMQFKMPSMRKPDFKRAADRWRAGIMAAAFIFIAGLAGYGGAWLQNNNTSLGLSSGNLSSQKKVVTSQSQLINEIAKTVGPSVVSVNVTVSSSSNADDPFGLFDYSQPREAQGAGTGVIISANGIVMTNRHVVPEGTSKVTVTLSDGTELKDVSVIDRTSASDTLDVAFLKINNSEKHTLLPAELGKSGDVQVGDAVVAIGNALGQFQNTVTNGIISGYGRSVQASSSSSNETESLDNLFQTDAAINQGNSGGPLVNMNGQVIGINTAVASDSQNIGFAIPIDDVKGLIEQITKEGKISRPYLGVHYVALTADIASEYKISVDEGALILPVSDGDKSSVVANSPADKAGLKPGDVITKVNGVAVDQTHSLTSLLGKNKPGAKVELTVVRGEETKTITATLGTLPSDSKQE